MIFLKGGILKTFIFFSLRIENGNFPKGQFPFLAVNIAQGIGTLPGLTPSVGKVLAAIET